MVTKEGQYKTKLPTVYKTETQYKLKTDYETGKQTAVKISKCPNCDKRKLDNKGIQVHEESNTEYEIRICSNCGYSNYKPVVKKEK